MPKPTINVVERAYIDQPSVEVGYFWEYHFVIEYRDNTGALIYSGEYGGFDMFENPMKDGYKVRAKAVINDGVTDTYYLDSAWSDWYVFEESELN